jgi:hypothetical protein
VIQAAGTGDDGLLRDQLAVSHDALRHEFAGFDFRILHIDGADAELLVAEQALIVVRHVVLDEQRRTFDSANLVGLVTAMVEIAVSDLAVIFLADRVIALANMHGHMDVRRQAFDCHVDGGNGGLDLVLLGYREKRLVDLDIPATGRRQHLEISVQQLSQIVHHLLDVAVMLVEGDLGQHQRPALTGRRVSAETILNSSASPRSTLSAIRVLQVAAG